EPELLVRRCVRTHPQAEDLSQPGELLLQLVQDEGDCTDGDSHQRRLNRGVEDNASGEQPSSQERDSRLYRRPYGGDNRIGHNQYLSIGFYESASEEDTEESGELQPQMPPFA